MLYAALIATGYVAGVSTWPKLRAWFNGAEAEVDALRAKAAALEAKINPFTGS